MAVVESPKKTQFAYEELVNSPLGKNVIGYLARGRVVEDLVIDTKQCYRLEPVSQEDYTTVALAICNQEKAVIAKWKDSSCNVVFSKSIDDIIVKATSVKLADVELKK